MAIYFIFFYLLLWGFVSINGRVGKMGHEKPLIYNSVVVQGILNIFSVLFLISTIILLIYNWELAILLFMIGMITCRIIFDSLVEKIIFMPFFTHIIKASDFNDLIIEGINITRQAQEGNALYSSNQFLAVDIHRSFVLWRFNVKEFVLKYYSKDAQQFFEADSVPDMKGGVEYGDVASEKSQILLKNIREEASRKLELLRRLKKGIPFWNQPWFHILELVGIFVGTICALYTMFSK